MVYAAAGCTQIRHHRPVPGEAPEPLGGLFSQVLRLLAAERGMVSLGTISLDGTKLAGNAGPQPAGRPRHRIARVCEPGCRGRHVTASDMKDMN